MFRNSYVSDRNLSVLLFKDLSSSGTFSEVWSAEYGSCTIVLYLTLKSKPTTWGIILKYVGAW